MASAVKTKNEYVDEVILSSNYRYTDNNYIGPAIYMIYNHTTNMYYIGMTVNYRSRVRRHFLLFSTDTHFNTRLGYCYKRGDELQGMLLETCDKSLLCEREMFWIKFLDATCREKGYNRTSGGDGVKDCIVSEETRRKLSIANKGKKQPVHAVEQMEKPILAYKLPTGEFYKEYQSTRHASRDIGRAPHHITMVLKEQVYSAKGYVFKYKTNENYSLKLKIKHAPKTWTRLINKIDIRTNTKVDELYSFTDLGKELGISNKAARSRIIRKNSTIFEHYKYELWHPQ